MTDNELILRLRQRDQAGLEDLSRRYSPLMRYIISPILSNGQDREECLSDVLLLVWERIERYDPARGAFSTWLTVLTRNTALNRARGQEVGEPLFENQASPVPGPEEQILHQELLEELKQAVDRLSMKDQLLFYRKYYYFQTTAQIAAEMGMTDRAAEGRLYRIKTRLRKELGGVML